MSYSMNTFQIIDEVSQKLSDATKIKFDWDSEDSVYFEFPTKGVNIGAQQLYELSGLFRSLALLLVDESDLDSEAVDELIDGYALEDTIDGTELYPDMYS